MRLIRRFFTKLKKKNKKESPDMNDSDDKPNGEGGFTYATLIVAFLGIIIIGILIAYCQYVVRQKDEEFKLLLHKNEEKAAYKFTWVKNQLNLMTMACKRKAEKIEQWQAWTSQNSNQKPPVELLTGQNQNDCVFASEMPEAPEGEK